MLQETATTWDLRNVDHWMPLDEKIFICITLVIGVAILSKIVRIWSLAPPFRRALPTDAAAYERYLSSTAGSLQRCLSLVFFAWAFLACRRLVVDCSWYVTTKSSGMVAFVGDLRDLLNCLLLTLIITLSAFLVRWYVPHRIDKLRA
jgi:hypothetical protein